MKTIINQINISVAFESGCVYSTAPICGHTVKAGDIIEFSSDLQVEVNFVCGEIPEDIAEQRIKSLEGSTITIKK